MEERRNIQVFGHRKKTMEPLIKLRDKDIFPKEMLFPEPETYEENKRVKGIILDDENKIALVWTKFKALPGGGVEEGETLEQAMKRECLEEAGCHIEIKKEIGFSDEYRAKRGWHMNVHFFVGKVVGEKGKPITTQEDERGMEAEWFTVDEAISILEEQIRTIPIDAYYNLHFNQRTHLMALKYYKKYYAN